mgnify:CR=1 FL=1
MDVQSLPQLLESRDMWLQIEANEDAAVRTLPQHSKRQTREARQVGETLYVHLERVQFLRGDGWCAAWHKAVVTKVYISQRKRLMDVCFEHFPDEYGEDMMYALPQQDPDCISSTFPYENKYWFETD